MTATAIFVDTSAFYAAVSLRDENHPAARDQWTALLTGDTELLTSNYVLVETLALLGRRLGLQAVRDFQTAFVPVLEICWADATLHARAVAALLAANNRDLSLVDCASFELMRERGLQMAFAFDTHFAQQGFRLVPGGN